MKQDSFFNALNNTMSRELLKYAAGLYMLCPCCERVLDWKTTVSIDLYRDGKHLKNMVGCTNCFKPEGIKKLKAKGLTVEVTKYEEPNQKP